MCSDAEPDPYLAEAIARAEHRRGMLEQISQFGLHLAMQIDAHAAAAMAAIHEPKTGDPTRPFSTIARTVRLTLAMEARIDAQILAMRKGKIPVAWGWAAPAARARVAGESATARPGTAHERLMDREDFEDLLDKPFLDCLERFELADEDVGGPAQAQPCSPAFPLGKPVACAKPGAPTSTSADPAPAAASGCYLADVDVGAPGWRRLLAIEPHPRE